jgi:hypothetical protein
MAEQKAGASFAASARAARSRSISLKISCRARVVRRVTLARGLAFIEE